MTKKQEEAGQFCPVVFYMYYILLVAIIFLDQVIKILVRHNMALGQSVQIISDFFSIKYIENDGMAFGMLSGNRLFLIVVPIIALVVIYLLWLKYKERFRPIFSISVMMILAGGASNIFDRIMFGSVTDYLSFKGFAIFNFADISATLGCVLLCISIWFFEKAKTNDTDRK